MPPTVIQRHPRYSLVLVICLTAILYLLASDRLSDIPTSSNYSYGGSPVDTATRVARAEKIYRKVLNDREGLIKKFGPAPHDVDMFPPNQDPWPAYTVWDFFPAAFNCPHEVERIGALGDGGKWVCGLSRLADKQDCVVYSVGINYESSFEAGILAGTSHCQIYGYDFTVDSFGPQIPASQRSRTHFQPFGLAGTDKHDQGGTKMYTLKSLMEMNGHTQIDILKIDIESWEFETLAALIAPYVPSPTSPNPPPLPFSQLQLEIHLWGKRFSEFLAWWEMLEKAGLRPFMTEPNLVYQNYNKEASTDLAEYSFINIKGNNVFVADPPPPDVRHAIRHGPRD